MLARIAHTVKDFIESFDHRPYSFMQLLAANGGVPGMTAAAPGTAPAERLQRSMIEGYRSVYAPRYSFFDLMADKGYAPFAAPVAVSGDQGFIHKTWDVIEGFANDNRLPGSRRRPRAA